ncbi:MAG: hypothetical protein M1812_007759 [Candelaria pacifica]|nr:MAG: hypothetical protein M1812_007759 [Candelaria pacifica]
MVSVSTATGLTITNPTVLYRALLATKRLDPDPSQHRLALHLQKLYYRLKDYEPEVEYGRRLEQISRAVGKRSASSTGTDEFTTRSGEGRRGVFSTLLAQKEKRDTLALTRALNSHEAALELKSPQGLLLYGEVGTGKSMLVDLLADCLPNRKKRRWHFNTFMLEIFARLEQLRRTRKVSATLGAPTAEEEFSLLWLARDMISTSPILFLDEFQLPDRATSKILSNLMTSFFQLGGVLIATSNRMPEELANASGMEFALPPASSTGSLGGRWGVGRRPSNSGRSESMFAGKGEFAGFLEVLKARCQIWDMEGGRDWRRREAEGQETSTDSDRPPSQENVTLSGFDGLEGIVPGNIGLGFEQSAHIGSPAVDTASDSARSAHVLPKKFHVLLSEISLVNGSDGQHREWDNAVRKTVLPERALAIGDQAPWEATHIRVYGRDVLVPRQHNGVTMWTFGELCGSNLGPADYITLASTFHTLILDNVPILTMLQKNEARRFITLLDALYEARCKLLVRAQAGPDELFFPESKRTPTEAGDPGTSKQDNQSQDQVYPETFSEIYQDLTSPFRPNVSVYTSETPTSTPGARFPTSPSSNSAFRSVLADEDSDFGPLNPRRFDGIPGAGNEIGRQGPEFTNTGSFTGEDERFAYKRARSRLWEMCGTRWWARTEEGWWKPVGKDIRRWERPDSTIDIALASQTDGFEGDHGGEKERSIFPHGASPFRTHQDSPPKFSWVHAWGMLTWGKKAGAWGRGPQGLKDKEKERKTKTSKD